MESVIKWQTGEPEERGSYIVSIKGLDTNFVTCAVYVHETGWCHWRKEEIIAWCKLSEIQPYKEDEKMKRRKSKKIFVPGTLVTVRGTNCVFMSLGMKPSCELESFNGFDISTGHPVRRCDGVVRLATKQECARCGKFSNKKPERASINSI